MRIKSVSMIAMAIALGAVAHAHATDPAPTSNPITTKLYVDNKFQDKITGYDSSTESQSILVDSTTAGTVQKRPIYNDTAANYNSSTQSTHIPTMGAVMSAISNATPATLTVGADETAAIGAYSTTFAASGTNVWPSTDASLFVNGTAFAGGLALKQNKISGYNSSTQSQSVLTDTTTDGVVGKMVIRTADDNAGESLDTWVEDNQIPTMGAIADAIHPLQWRTAEQNAAGAYSTTFADSGTNVWPTEDAISFVKGQTFANAMATKQNIIPANNATTYPNGSVVTYGATAGTPGQVAIATAPSYNQQTGALENGTQIASIAAVDTMQKKIDANDSTTYPNGSVVTYGATAGTPGQVAIATAPSYNQQTGALENGTQIASIAAVNTMQKKIAANNATTYPNGSVVTYGATAGTPGQVAIATAPSYNQQTGALENGTQIASIAAVNTMQRKRVCVGWATGHENDDDYCYFWDWPD